MTAMPMGRPWRRPAALVACAAAGLAAGWSFGLASAARDHDAHAAGPQRAIESASTPPASKRAEPSCDRVRAELDAVRREAEQLERRTHLRAIERSIAEGERPWPHDAPEGMMPSAFEQMVLDLGEELDVAIDDVDCAAYPCFAILADSSDEEGFDAARKGLDARCGRALEHYGAVSFDRDGRASYAIACVPTGDDAALDELKDGLRARAFERLAEAGR